MTRRPQDWQEARQRIIGFGEESHRKSYYPELRQKITELETAREQLRISEGNLRSVLNNMHDAILLHDGEGRVLEVNEAMRTLYRISREDVKRFGIADYSDPGQPDPVSVLREVLQEGEKVFEWKARRPLDGSLFDVEVAIRPMVWYGQQIFVASVREITERKRMEQWLGEAQKMEALGRFASRVAHDVTNSMTAILRSSAKLQTLLTAEQTEARMEVEHIAAAIERHSGFYADLLAFAAQRPGRESMLDFGGITRGMTNFLERSAHPGIRCRMEITEEPLPILGDPVSLEHILVYLTLHAFDRMPQGGEFSLRVFKRCVKTKEARACLHVEDTGQPYAEEDLPRLCEPFFVPRGGLKLPLGMRLSNVYAVVHALGGELRVRSGREKTRVTVELPLSVDTLNAPSNRPPLQNERPPDQNGGPRGVVLLVEDELTLRTLFNVQLSKLGLHVLSAEHGEAALQIADEYPGPIDYVLTDMTLGDLQGHELVRTLREKRPELHVVLMSGFRRAEMLERGLLEPEDIFLEKPFHKEDLIRALRRKEAPEGEGTVSPV